MPSKRTRVTAELTPPSQAVPSVAAPSPGAAAESDSGHPIPALSDGQGLQVPQDTATAAQEPGSGGVPPFVVPPPPGAAGEPRRGRGRPRMTAEEKAARRAQDRYNLNSGDPEKSTLDHRAFAAQSNDDRYRANAKMAVSVTTGGLETAIPGWTPCEDSERAFLENATYEYFKAKQIPDLPPGWVLCFALTMYALPRIQNNEWLIAKLASFRK